MVLDSEMFKQIIDNNKESWRQENKQIKAGYFTTSTWHLIVMGSFETNTLYNFKALTIWG